MNGHHLLSVSGSRWCEGKRAVWSRYTAWWYHQRRPLRLPAGWGARCTVARSDASLNLWIAASRHSHGIKVNLCQLSEQDLRVDWHIPPSFLRRQPYSFPKSSWGNRFTFHLAYTHVHKCSQTQRSYLETQRGKNAHLVPWQRHFTGKLEWHQLHSDKNGFGPGCWLSNTFWRSSRGRFIRSQIRQLAFTPKHRSHAERRQTQLMHTITSGSKFLTTTESWKVYTWSSLHMILTSQVQI